LPEAAAARIEAAVRAAHRPGEPLVVGLCGAQGSGKSTLAAAVAVRLHSAGLHTVILSLDDLYLPAADRQRLAKAVHPLFAVRGPPGTHDVDLGLRVLDAVKGKRDFLLPRYDKAMDDRAPQERWCEAKAPVDVILFEGWCVGARPEAPEALTAPVNALERDEDQEGRWRACINGVLANEYQALFDRIDLLILLAAPSFEIVTRWRTEQEKALRLATQREGRSLDKVMSDDEVARFVQHYERLTRHILKEMPGRADHVLRLDENRVVTS
jgi:D-glycerate 3-kinase